MEFDGFATAQDALIFAATLKAVTDDVFGELKFRAGIGVRGTQLAITPEYVGKTSLQVTFLELKGDEMARAVVERIKVVVQNYAAVRNVPLEIHKEVIRDKPQPQFIGGEKRPNQIHPLRTAIRRELH